MGAIPTQFPTLTQAELQLDNGIDLRVKEFGSDFARCIAGGLRNVALNFEIFEQEDDQRRRCTKPLGRGRRSK